MNTQVELEDDTQRFEFGRNLPKGPFDLVVLAVAHSDIVALGVDRLNALMSEDGLIYDIKGIVPAEHSGGRI